MTPIEKDPTTGINGALAATLRAERAAERMTVDALAAHSGIPKRTLIRLLNAERPLNMAHLASLANALHLPVTVLVERAEQRLGQEF